MIRNCGVSGIAVAVLLVVSVPFARAESTQLHTSLYGMTMTGQLFWKNCRSVRAEKARCLGYVMGLMDGLAIMQNALARERATYPSWSPVCTPRDVTGDEAVTVLVNYLRRHPDSRNQPALALFLRAVRESWPGEPS